MTTVLIAAGLALLAAAALLLVRVLRQPDTFNYARSETIGAPPERIFPLIADPKAFNAWSPFNEDPAITGSYSGPERSPGARYTFASRRGGAGYTEITEEAAPHRLAVRLVMTRPLACDNQVEFTLAPVAGGTRVTWGMSGRMNFAGKLMNAVMDCERMCGNEFSRGLAKLKRLAEETPAVGSSVAA